MDIYLYGVGVAFLISLYKWFVNTMHLRSEKTRNLKQVGLYFSCTNGDWVQGDASAAKYISYSVYTLLVAPLFSWLSVMMFLGQLAFHRYKRGITPKNERALALLQRLDARGLSKADVEEILAQVAESVGRDAVTEPLKLNSEGTATAQVNRTRKQVSIWSRSDDWEAVFDELWEYRLAGSEVEIRTLEDTSKHLATKHEFVKDGVVIEDAVREFWQVMGPEVQQEKIQALRASVEWHRLENPVLRYFILAQHPDVLPRTEFRRIVREDIERLKRGAAELSAAGRAMGFAPKETEAGTDLCFTEMVPADRYEEFKPAFKEAERRSGLKPSELSCWKTLVRDLGAFLEEPKRA